MNFFSPKYLIFCIFLLILTGVGIGVTANQGTPRAFTGSLVSQIALSHDPNYILSVVGTKINHVSSATTAGWGDIVNVRYSLYLDAQHTDPVENNVDQTLEDVYLGPSVPQELQEQFPQANAGYLDKFKEGIVGAQVNQPKEFVILAEDAYSNDINHPLYNKDLYYIITLLEIIYDASIVPIPPIKISGNNDFESYGFPGNGSKINPYRIEEKLISSGSSDLIDIQDTTAYFIISNCSLDGLGTSSMGIVFENVTHATIIDNTITEIVDDGIAARNCSYNTIQRNTIFNCDGIGIHIYGYTQTISDYISGTTIKVYHISTHNNLSDNVIYNCLGGISFTSTAYNIIENNTIFNGTIPEGSSGKYSGITLLGKKEEEVYKEEFPSGNHLIQNNLISKFDRGIHIQESIDNLILNNTIHGNDDVCISTSDVSENIFIKWNDFIYNNPSMPKPSRPQASDNGLNNTFAHNFWDDGRLPDNDQDGFADVPYFIWGDHYDNSPLTHYNNPQTLSLHIIARPIILSPDANESVQGLAKILWASAIDYKEHSITYDLYYSTDWGESWTEIITGISDTSYEWDAPDSSGDCRIKVVATCAQGKSVDAFSEELRLKSAIPGWTFLTLLSVFCLIVALRRFKRKST